jgi:hypothetical protein
MILTVILCLEHTSSAKNIYPLLSLTFIEIDILQVLHVTGDSHVILILPLPDPFE